MRMAVHTRKTLLYKEHVYAYPSTVFSNTVIVSEPPRRTEIEKTIDVSCPNDMTYRCSL